jgi:sugar phosphate isomerase/epimerase
MSVLASMRRLTLEHLTISRASPGELVEIAARHGCGGAALLLSGLKDYPETGDIDLVGDHVERRATRRAAHEAGIDLDWAYPFILSARRAAASLVPRLEAAADLGAHGVLLLMYDRDTTRAADELAAFCAIAGQLGLAVTLEFYPASAVRTLAAARGLVARCGAANLGICVDLLHARRAGDEDLSIQLAAAQINHAQLCDAALERPADTEWEAMHGRLLPGEGELGVAGFLRALPTTLRLGVEVPNRHFNGDIAHQAAIALGAAARLLEVA